MPRRCSVCAHGEVRAIDEALVAGGSLRAVGEQFGLSPSALSRHRREHIQLDLEVPGHEPAASHGQGAPTSPAIDVAQQLKAINAACLEVLTRARQEDRATTLLKAVDRIHRQIDLQAKLLRTLQSTAAEPSGYDLSKWPSLRQVVVDALRPYPEARQAVVEALGHAEARPGH